MGPRGMRNCKARSGHRAGLPCHKRRAAYERLLTGTRRRRLTALLHHIGDRCSAVGFCQLKKRAAARSRCGDMGPIRGEPGGQPRDLHGASTQGRIERCHRGGSIYRRRMATNGRSASPPSRTRLSRRRWWQILTPIYEAEFLGFSYGFRPGRSQHDALDALAYGIRARKICGF